MADHDIAAAGIPMQTHAWMQARSELLFDPTARRLVAVADGAAIAAFACLARTGDWLREPPAMFEPGDLVWRDTESLGLLAESLARQPLPILLERLPAASPSLAALRRAYRGRGIVLVREAMPTPWIDLVPLALNLDAGLNAGRRSDFRRMAREALLSEQSPTRFMPRGPKLTWRRSSCRLWG